MCNEGWGGSSEKEQSGYFPRNKKMTPTTDATTLAIRRTLYEKPLPSAEETSKK